MADIIAISAKSLHFLKTLNLNPLARSPAASLSTLKLLQLL